MRIVQLEGLSREDLDFLIARNPMDSTDVVKVCEDIFEEVCSGGDRALLRLTREFDSADLDNLEVSDQEFAEALTAVGEEETAALSHAARNIRFFHSKQLYSEPPVQVESGVLCWRESRAIEKVGLYVPSGSAPLPSSLLMLGIPAVLAGCREIVVCAPPGGDGRMDPYILVAAQMIGINKLFKLGGAQAIAAMVYGTETVPAVDKIAGPGSRIVQVAKTLAVRSGMAIDLVAGPSEVLVIADSSSDPGFIAADLLSQCEHGSDSQAVLVTTSREQAELVIGSVEEQLASLPRRELARLALKESFAIVVSSVREGIDFSNRYGPEHLILHVEDPAKWVPEVQSAGSVFLGPWSPEVAGDYASGTNHTLPTSGGARAFSGVSVDTFLKRITFQELSLQGLKSLGGTLQKMAGIEGLQGHARAVSCRLESEKSTSSPDARDDWDFLKLVRPQIMALKPYRSARGDGLGQGILMDANENPYEVDWQDISLNRYPDPNQTQLRLEIAEYLRVTSDYVVAGTGSDEVLDWIFKIFCIPGCDSVAIGQPTYGMYKVLADTHGVESLDFCLDKEFDLPDEEFLKWVPASVKLLFLCSPNNPTGNLLTRSRISKICREWAGVVVLDEAYGEFSDEASWARCVPEFSNLVVVRTLSKAWGRAALRLGYVVASPALIELIMKVKAPYNLGSLQMQLGVEALRDVKAMNEQVSLLKQGRNFLSTQLESLPNVGTIFPSQANFILFNCNRARDVYLRLREKGILVRDRSDLPGLENTLRVSVGTANENQQFVSTLENVFKEFECHV
jgi:histidinol dehydrogenase